ncbi:cupredoxin domain-containing protein [Haloarcula salinisoli]|uniref:Blue (type 1) copper domain-containing protein n=1 Tax=Haloarcula salinisoli TaxID=2487746 RepID=A0A8J8C8T6_9EURY|nr:plastocyanin/azurin family copper-binding protein [Halomicroarcula salinisoli]MBX0287738.1 hypothetical protein [Halomicroarcula salinisoli]MBX0304662.1 hypothetical protein [Halomicroarcula salinisoli]
MPTQTSDPDSEPILDRPVLRRPLLKALGGGVALSLGGGAVVAGQETETTDGIDSYYGYPVPDPEAIPTDLEPDHEVTLHADLPEDLADPERPPYFHYEPSGLAVEPGDVVQFTAVTPDHSVTAYHPEMGFQQRVPDDVAPFSSPVLSAGAAWLYEFDEPGVYDVYCGPHHVLGMVMRLVVGDVEADYVDTFEGREPTDDQPPLFAPFSQAFLEQELNALSDENEECEWPWVTPVEVLSAPALDPENVQEVETVPFEDVLEDLERFDPIETESETETETETEAEG